VYGSDQGVPSLCDLAHGDLHGEEVASGKTLGEKTLNVWIKRSSARLGMAAGRRRATEASRRAPLDDDRPIEGGPILSSVAVGWSDGKPRPVPDDMRRWLKGNPSSPGGDGGSCSPDQRARMPRPRSANAPKPALTVDYSRVARNEVDAFTLGCSQVEQLTLSNAENVRQLEYLAKASEGFIGSAHATAGELRQSRALCPGGPPLSALVASSHGAEKKAAAASMHPARTNRARQEEYGKKGGLRGEGGRAGRSGLTCAVMIVALVVQPVVSQTVRQAADSTSAFEAHGRRAMESGDDMKLECARGNHRTSGDVTTSGDGTCRRPRRAHAVDVNDHFGKLIAPLYTHEFLLESAAGPWGSSPRHISRQDPRYFADFGLSQDHHVHELLRKSCPLSDPGGKKRGMHNLEDVKLVRGRRASRLLVGHHAAAPAAHAAGDALSWKDAVSYFDAGFSVFLRHVDLRSAPLSRFVQGLEDELAIPMQAHLQWTPPLSEGGGEHTGHLTDGMGQGPDAPGGGVRRASVEQVLAFARCRALYPCPSSPSSLPAALSALCDVGRASSWSGANTAATSFCCRSLGARLCTHIKCRACRCGWAATSKCWSRMEAPQRARGSSRRGGYLEEVWREESSRRRWRAWFGATRLTTGAAARALLKGKEPQQTNSKRAREKSTANRHRALDDRLMFTSLLRPGDTLYFCHE